jgi:hypothetical protein
MTTLNSLIKDTWHCGEYRSVAVLCLLYPLLVLMVWSQKGCAK